MNKGIPLLLCLAALLMAVGCKEKPLSADSEAEAIREVRERNNRAIANHDIEAMMVAWMDNFLLISSRDAQVEGRDQVAQIFKDDFDTKEAVVYVRMPEEIQVMETWSMASEYGNWTGSWKAEDGQVEVGGTYFAKWHKVGGTWLLRAEVFTPLYCRGGNYCAKGRQ